MVISVPPTSVRMWEMEFETLITDLQQAGRSVIEESADTHTMTIYTEATINRKMAPNWL